MSATELKLKLHEAIEAVDENVLNQLYSIILEQKTENFIQPGEAMSEQMLLSRVKKAKNRISKGEFTTQEDLKSEMEKW